jgi:hypothetical protein
MTNDKALWAALQSHLPRNRWVPITDIFTIVQRRILLDADDLACGTAHRTMPRWRNNVRRVLHAKRREGTLQSRTSA